MIKNKKNMDEIKINNQKNNAVRLTRRKKLGETIIKKLIKNGLNSFLYSVKIGWIADWYGYDMVIVRPKIVGYKVIVGINFRDDFEYERECYVLPNFSKQVMGILKGDVVEWNVIIKKNIAYIPLSKGVDF